MAESEPKKDDGGGGGGGSSKLLLGLLALNSLITVAVLVVVLLRTGAPKHPPLAAGGEPAAAKAEGHGDPKGEKALADKANLPGPIVKFPDFVVHLRDPEVDRYARLTIEVEVQDEKVREALTLRLPAIRDSFIAYLSDRSTADLRGSEAIARAKGELLDRLKVSAPGLGLRGLYVTELVVQ